MLDNMNIDVALAALGDRLEALGATESDIVSSAARLSSCLA